jgi:hypothetical protein
VSEEPTERGFAQRVREFVAASRTGEAGSVRRRGDRDHRTLRALLACARSIVARAIAKLRAGHASPAARDSR